MRKSVSMFLLITNAAIIFGCASSRSITTFDTPTGKLKCAEPPPDVITMGAKANIDAIIPNIKADVEANASASTMVARIRSEVPNLQAVEALEYRMCLAYGNGIIDSDAYKKFIGSILPMLQVVDDIDKPTSFNGSNDELVSFVGWHGHGSFAYTGGSCKGCPDLETYRGTGSFRPEVMVKDPKYVKRLDFLKGDLTIDTQDSGSIKSGSNVLFKGIEHSIIKVDGARNNFYGGKTSYCWSGTHQECAANAGDNNMMMAFVVYRLNKDSYKIRVTKSNGEIFLINLPEVAY